MQDEKLNNNVQKRSWKNQALRSFSMLMKKKPNVKLMQSEDQCCS